VTLALKRFELGIGMTVFKIDPIGDVRWAEFLHRHAGASVFHTPGWLEALRRTYGYKPIVLTTSPPTTELTNGLAFCQIDSWLTGRRMVSLPFSDHCEPLVDSPAEVHCLLSSLERERERENWKYIEMRPVSPHLGLQAGLEQSQAFCFHKLDLRPSAQELFRGFHKDCVQRKIRRAERENLTYEKGRSTSLLDQFYRLLLLTRRRQQLPPHPLTWFRNLIECLGDQLQVRLASRAGRPIASILTLQFKNIMVYKYGCSDASFNNLGAMHFLFWKTIEEAKNIGLQEFDLGRSDCDNPGLIAFKDRWGAARTKLVYSRYPRRPPSISSESLELQIAKKIFARMPDDFLTAVGRLLYRHIG
jgi:CelD/BcsL family acetyltransferase involved in cellulose biosynthesis